MRKAAMACPFILIYMKKAVYKCQPLSNKQFVNDAEVLNGYVFLINRNISTIAVFYALPVIQLVITYQTVLLAPYCIREKFSLVHTIVFVVFFSEK